MRLPALQDPVALGMTAYVRATFTLRVSGLEHLRIEPRSIIAASHRSDNDVPVLMTAIYPELSAAVARGVPWPTFAAMVELFLPGFFAGYPDGLPLRLRRLLWPTQPGGVLARHLQCVPVREPERMRLLELLSAAPEEPIDGRLPAELEAGLARRAAKLGRPAPVFAADAIDGAYADLLWATVDRADVPEPEDVWRAHALAGVGDFRRLAERLAGGGVVIIFPEGDLSADGEIGALRPGLGSLARRGRARRVQPVALSYDPLASPRSRAYVSFAPAIEPVPGRLVDSVAAALRAATPLTPGQLAASAVVRAGERAVSYDAVIQAAEEAIARSRAEGRPVEPALVAPGRERTLRRALDRARRRGAGDPLVRRLARELESASGA